ncbi:hypothetical protein GCM10027258_81000 [Amycolatopsis stemonae]
MAGWSLGNMVVGTAVSPRDVVHDVDCATWICEARPDTSTACRSAVSVVSVVSVVSSYRTYRDIRKRFGSFGRLTGAACRLSQQERVDAELAGSGQSQSGRGTALIWTWWNRGR